MERYTPENLHRLYDKVAGRDPHLQEILTGYGYPPLWIRSNSFETLVLTILEQQVSLASAYAAYKKIRERLTTITPEKLLELTDEELRNCYFSRQKIRYTRELAQAFVSQKIRLEQFEGAGDEEVRSTLKALKGIGDWTVDIYLIHALQRTDIFPLGDVALVKAIKWVKDLPGATREELLQLGEPWRPYRSLATMILWHYYIKKKNIILLH